jgi:hypothetical protein
MSGGSNFQIGNRKSEIGNLQINQSLLTSSPTRFMGSPDLQNWTRIETMNVGDDVRSL